MSNRACSATRSVSRKQLLAEVEDAQVAEHLALRREERRVAAAPGVERLDVVGDLSGEELLRAGAAQRELAPFGAVEQATALGERPVLGVERRCVGRGHRFEDSHARLHARWASPTHSRQIVDSLPDDWTDLELDLRLADESRYVEAAVYLTTCNAQPYSHHDWHWRLLVAHRFGHAASAPTVHGTLGLLDDAGIEGELVVREVRAGAPRSRRCGAARSRCAKSSAPARAVAHYAHDGARGGAGPGPAVRLAGAGHARGGRRRGRAGRGRSRVRDRLGDAAALPSPCS